LDLQLEFVDMLNQVVLRETAHAITSRTPPLKPGEKRAFRVSFDHMPAYWSQAPPAITVKYLGFRVAEGRMSGLPSGSWPQISRLPGFMKAQVGLASLLLIVQPLCAFSALQSQGNPSGQAGAAPVSEPKFRILRSVSGSRSSQDGGRFVIQDP